MNLCIMPRPSGISCSEVSDFFISESVFNALNKMELKMDADNVELTEICKIYNPHEYVFSNVIDTPISKLKPSSNLYYELYEIFNTFGIFKTLHKKSNLIHIEKEITISITPFYLLFNNATIITHCNINEIVSNKTDFIFIDLDVCLILALDVILKLLNNEGTAIIKLTSVYTKQSISVLYLLSIIFEKTFIVKPTVINILSNDIFIVCISRTNKSLTYNNNIMSIDIPAFFLYKIEEFNSINGHRQLDAYEQIFNLLHNKHRTNKLELLKKTNIQKSIGWCEKHNIPYNKFGDKINMFL